MRSNVFLLMLALCLASLVCAASTEEGELDHSKENKPTALGTPTPPTSPEDPSHDVQNTHSQSSEKTTKKPELTPPQPHTGTPSQKQPQVPEPQQPSPIITSHTSKVQAGEQGGVTGHGDDNPLNKEMTPPEHPERIPADPSQPQLQPKQTPPGQTQHQQQQQQQQQQLQAPPPNKSQSPEKSPEPTGDVLQPGQTEPLTSRTEEESRAAPAKLPQKSTPGVTGHQDSGALQDPPKNQQKPSAPIQPVSTNQLSSSSQSSGTGVQQTAERPSSPTNTDKPDTKGTPLSPNHSEKTPKDHNDAQVLLPTSSDGKTNLPDTNKTPKTTPDKNPVAAQKPEPLTPTAADNVTTQTATTTGDEETHPAQTSETTTAEPVKKEFTLPTNTSKKLSKAMKSLNMTDSSIGSSLLISFAALIIVIVMAVAPAS